MTRMIIQKVKRGMRDIKNEKMKMNCISCQQSMNLTKETRNGKGNGISDSKILSINKQFQLKCTYWIYEDAIKKERMQNGI